MNIKKHTKKVSIIIPVYNGEKFIRRCVDSCLNQDYQNVEIIIINDGSNDSTKNILESIYGEHENVIVYHRSNQGQGSARNFGVMEASGDYIYFVDADDEIHRKCIGIILEEAEKRGSDIVLHDWYFENDSGVKFKYSNMQTNLTPGILKKKDRGMLLNRTYFTVAKLYRRAMLIDEDVRYGEGFIYEDVPFFVGAILGANTISYVSRPFYCVHTHAYSTTKVSYDSNVHSNGFKMAVAQTLSSYKGLILPYYRPFIHYILNRAFLYAFTQKRIPKKEHYNFITDLLMYLHDAFRECITYKLPPRFRYPVIAIGRSKVIAYCLYFILHKVHRKKWMRDIYRNIAKSRREKNKINNQKRIKKYIHESLTLDINENVVFFHSFDGSVKGNTLYFLRALADTNYNIYVAAKKLPQDLKDAHNIKKVRKGTRSYYLYGNSARFHFLETWGAGGLSKRPGSTWVQLWHGTPIKRMLFDSDEVFITSRRVNHKASKLSDIFKWDYLLSQNKYCTAKLESSFSYDRANILEFGYPRTDHFLESLTRHDEVRDRIRIKYGISKPLILYAPTWRDYNKYSRHQSPNYFLCPNKMLDADKFEFLFVGHHFANDVNLFENVFVAEGDDLQDLLIAADYLITDYSSVLFDWLILEKPFVLLWKDFELFEYSRGVYSEVMEDFKSFIVRDEANIVELLMGDCKYQEIKNIDKYRLMVPDSSKRIHRFMEMCHLNMNQDHSGTDQ